MPPKKVSRKVTSRPNRRKRCTSWQKVLNDYCTSVVRPSLKEFVESNPELIKRDTTYKTRGKALWVNRFKRAIKAANISDYLLDEPDWTFFGFVDAKAQRPSKTSAYQLPFDASECDKFKQMFRSLADDRKWKLFSGRYVENILYDYALQCKFITPAHNLILDLEDARITELFTEKELEEIKNKRPFKFEKDLSKDINSYFHSLKAKYTFDELFQSINSISPTPKSNKDLYWIKKTMLTSLELFISSSTLTLSTKVSERDLVRLVWSCLLNCCIGSDVVVSTEKQSLSSIISNNLNRSVASTSGLVKQTPGQLPDICFSYANYEFGFCEAERYNKGDCATKRLLESKVKLPSMMKKALIRLLQRVNQKRLASIIGFYVSELEIEAIRMCSPCGFVCLITRSSTYTFPATLNLFKKDMQKLVTVVQNMKNEMLRNIDLITEDDERAAEQFKLPMFTFPL